MMFGEMIAGEAFALDQLNEPQPTLVQRMQRLPVRIKMIENAELHGRRFFSRPHPDEHRAAMRLEG
jgi:hypothetical protein